MQQTNRPLSPHLQVYRPQLTSVLSISHRATGVALAGGAVLLTWWLLALAAGPDAYRGAHAVLASAPGKIALFVFTYAIFYHLCNGVRHLFWDAGLGFDLDVAYRSGYAVLAVSAIMTLITWAVILSG